jgi:hypothetical protein
MKKKNIDIEVTVDNVKEIIMAIRLSDVFNNKTFNYQLGYPVEQTSLDYRIGLCSNNKELKLSEKQLVNQGLNKDKFRRYCDGCVISNENNIFIDIDKMTFDISEYVPKVLDISQIEWENETLTDYYIYNEYSDLVNEYLNDNHKFAKMIEENSEYGDGVFYNPKPSAKTILKGIKKSGIAHYEFEWVKDCFV